VISPLRILYLEDEPNDAELVRETLEAEGIACRITRVEAEPEFSISLEQSGFELVLADYTLPSFDGISALKIVRKAHPEVPFIFVSGTLGEEVSIEALKLGATDYVLKTRLSRIGPSVRRALREAEEKIQRRRAEEALRRNEAYLVEAQRLSHTGSFGWQVSSGEIHWSEETFRIFGFEPVIPMTLERAFERIHPEDRQFVRRVIDSAAQERKNFDFEHRLLMPDNTSVKYLRIVGYPSTKEESGELEFAGAVLDITERKQGEQARQELEEQWRAAFESNPTMYFVIDAAGKIVSVNLFGAEQLGYSVTELVDEPVMNVFYESDREAVQKHAKECFDQPGRMMRWEARKIRKDGTMLWVRETGNVVVLKKRPVLLVVCENITEQKRAEEAARRSEKELRDVIETVPVMAFSVRPDGSTEFVNRRVLEYTGLSLDAISGREWQSALHPDDLEEHTAKWRASLKSGEPLENESRHRSASGEYRWFLVRAVPLRDEQGNILRWYGILADIDDRKRAEALLTGEKRVLEMVAKGDSLAQILDTLCRLAEEQASDVLASILLLEGNRLRHGGAPSLPKAYTDAIDGGVIGPSAGSCGTAAYREEQVIVEDIATDPLWEDYRDIALPHSLRACWSTPVFSSQGKLIATFAMYYREPRSPSRRDQELIEQITHLAGVAIERKLTQNALRRSEAYLTEAQTLNKTGSWAYNPSTGKTVYWSEEMFRICGFDPQQGPPSSEALWERFHPEDREPMSELLQKAARETTDYEHEHRIVLPDGTVKHLHVIGHPVLNGTGEVMEHVGTTIDITERKRAEETLRRSEAYLAEAQRLNKTGSWAFNPFSGQNIYWSEEMFRIYGLDSQRDLPTSEAFWGRVHPDDRDSMYEIMRNATLEKTEYEHEHRIVLPDGTVKHLHAIGHPVLNRAGDVVQFVGTAVDVTERKRAEEERERLRHVEADLAHINRVNMMGELTASLGHEIKQPIAAAVSNAETCLEWLDRDQPDLAEIREAAAEMVKEARRAADIMTRTHALFKKEELKREVLDLNAVIAETATLIRAEADRRSISVLTEQDAELSKISADRVQLQQVLMNLMLNGLEAMKDTRGELVIRSQRVEGGRPLISVSDAGTGFPSGAESRIFDPFFTTKPQGTGMGLAICRSIIESHGGRLWATANSGPGATFYFTLPNEGTEGA
jgi:PAS domain S-box-containing protein